MISTGQKSFLCQPSSHSLFLGVSLFSFSVKSPNREHELRKKRTKNGFNRFQFLLFTCEMQKYPKVNTDATSCFQIQVRSFFSEEIWREKQVAVDFCLHHGVMNRYDAHHTEPRPGVMTMAPMYEMRMENKRPSLKELEQCLK